MRNTGFSPSELESKMSEIQVKLFDENIEERELEALNIEYEKLIIELESKKEYIDQIYFEKSVWNNENADVNKYIIYLFFYFTRIDHKRDLNSYFNSEPNFF